MPLYGTKEPTARFGGLYSVLLILFTELVPTYNNILLTYHDWACYPISNIKLIPQSVHQVPPKDAKLPIMTTRDT